MNRFALSVVWLIAGLSLAGFFLPWIQKGPKDVASLSEYTVRSLAMEEERDYWRFVSIPPEERKRLLQEPLKGTSGFTLWKSWRKPVHPLLGGNLFSTKKSLNPFWIFAVPAGALLGAIFFTLTTGWGPFIGIGSTLGIYLTVRWNLQEALIDRLVSGIHIGIGLWIGLYALLALSLCLSVRWALGLFK